ncbi:MAG: DUF1565 domain-containing protein [Planctomycetes bacterium]|nr:DUF1565 domain-containing protein [Planctomycetota bacterium]
MRLVRLALFASLASLSLPLSAQSEWWVDPVAGADVNPGSITLPLRTLSFACSVAGANDHIHLLPGLYGPAHNGEVLPITLGFGTVQNDLVIRGLGGAVLDLGGSASTVFRLANGADRLRITNLTFLNSDQAGWWTRVISSGSGVNSADAASDVELDRCQFVNCNRGIVLWTSDNVQGWKIHDNLFWNLTNDAILEYTGDNDVYNNTFVTGTYKAYISDSTTSRCQNNLIVGYAIGFENNNAANSVARYEHNWLHQTPIVTQGVGLATALPSSNVIGVDPQFVGAAAGDFHLQATSPCLDAGTAAIFARSDLDGVARLVDVDQNGSLLPDIGCYESSPVSMTTSYDPSTQLMTVQSASTLPGVFTAVLFSFDDGMFPIPGQGPILVDQATFIPYWLTSAAPGYWVLNFQGLSLPPGLRLVSHVLGLYTTPVAIGGNQVWTQL